MNKQEWLQIKKSGNYPLDLFWEYWNLKSNNTGTAEDFQKNFNLFIQKLGGAPVQRLNEHYDQKFNVTKLLTKEGDLIKEY